MSEMLITAGITLGVLSGIKISLKIFSSGNVGELTAEINLKEKVEDLS